MKTIVLLLFAAGWINLSAENLSIDGFSQLKLNPALVKLSVDGKSISVDTANVNNDWNTLIQTKPGALQPMTSYTASFRCRVEEPDIKNKFFHIICRPLSAPGGNRDTLHQNYGDSAGWETVTIPFQTNEAADYSFQIHSFRRLKGEIADFKLLQSAANEFIAFADHAEPFTGSFGTLPTGAKEFSVNLPQIDGKTVVNAADFGVSEQNTDNTLQLNRALEHCRKIGAGKLVLAPGVYQMTANEPVRLENMRDFELDGGGATLVYRKQQKSNFRVENCERVKLGNFNMDWDWAKDPLASVVEVTRADDHSVDFRFRDYDKFPRRDMRIAILSSFDPVTNSVGIEGGFTRSFEFFAGKERPDWEWLTDNTLRIKGNPGQFTPFQAGQLFRMQHYYYDMNGIEMQSNTHLTLQNINIYSCAGHALVVGGTQQYWQFVKVNIAAPKNDKKRVITCTADHCHIMQSRGFFQMENCEFSLGADDCLNVHDISAYAVKSGPTSVTTRNFRSVGTIAPGMSIELRHGDYSPSGFTGKIVSVTPVDPAKGEHLITFAETVPEPNNEGFILFNRHYDSRNIIIRNSYFHDNRARGLLILARDVTIENNRFFHNEMGAIKLETGYTFNLWSEGYGVKNVVIRNNFFDSVNPSGAKNDGKERDIYMGVYLKRDPSSEQTKYPILSDILLENNTFKDTYGMVAFISSVQNLTIRDNVFYQQTPRKRNLPYRGSFILANASNVKIVNNRMVESPLMPKPGVYFNPDSCQNIVVEGNAVTAAPMVAP